MAQNRTSEQRFERRDDRQDRLCDADETGQDERRPLLQQRTRQGWRHAAVGTLVVGQAGSSRHACPLDAVGAEAALIAISKRRRRHLGIGAQIRDLPAKPRRRNCLRQIAGPRDIRFHQPRPAAGLVSAPVFQQYPQSQARRVGSISDTHPPPDSANAACQAAIMSMAHSQWVSKTAPSRGHRTSAGSTQSRASQEA